MVSYDGKEKAINDGTHSLNPCCNGQWSRTALALRQVSMGAVLILVVVDNGLVQRLNYGNNFSRSVLILIVMDNGLVQRWSNYMLLCLWVLILVVMEDGLALDLIRHY